MKKKSQSHTVLLLKNIINIPAWFDLARMKVFTDYLLKGFKALFIPKKNTQTESFDKAMKELNLTEAEVLTKQKSLFQLSIMMLSLAALIFVYAAYQLIFGSFKSFIVSMIVTLIALTLAYRYHFWYFQIKERVLGCTFRQWFRQGLLREKK